MSKLTISIYPNHSLPAIRLSNAVLRRRVPEQPAGKAITDLLIYYKQAIY